MEHTLPFSSVSPIEGIQTANKNIYSYFMKNDSSYYVPPCHRYAGYKKPTDVTYIVVISKYTPATGDYLYKHNSNSIQMECLIGKSIKNLQKRSIILSDLFAAVRDIEYSTPGIAEIKPSDVFIGLVYPDGVNRVGAMNMIDSILNHSGFKGILVLPFSLSVSLGLGVSNSLYFSAPDRTIAGIEDNCISDSFTDSMPSSTSLYGSDVVEEFLKKEDPVKQKPLNIICHICSSAFEINEFGMHFLNKHGVDIYKDLQASDQLLYMCEIQQEETEEKDTLPLTLELGGRRMISRISPAERLKKITSTIIIVTSLISTEHIFIEEPDKKPVEHKTEMYTPESIPEDAKLISSIVEDLSSSSILYVSESEKAKIAWNGLFALNNIEPGKDLWLTDKEWQTVGLRILKEKVLFPI